MLRTMRQRFGQVDASAGCAKHPFDQVVDVCFGEDGGEFGNSAPADENALWPVDPDFDEWNRVGWGEVE